MVNIYKWKELYKCTWLADWNLDITTAYIYYKIEGRQLPWHDVEAGIQGLKEIGTLEWIYRMQLHTQALHHYTPYGARGYSLH